MNKVCMVEYQGRIDENGKALGHGPKVLNEYFDFIKDYCQVSVYAPREILNEFRGAKISHETKILPGKIVMGQDKTVLIKIKNKLNMFKNISLMLKNTDSDTVWFFNAEYYFFLYLFLHRRISKTVVCTMFLDSYRGGIAGKIKQYIFEKAQKKLDVIIATGPQLSFKNCKQVYIPDYYYDEDKLEQYRGMSKEKLAVCLGTMGKGKQLKEMVEAFNKKGYPLVIAGRFYNKELLEELKNISADNIEIRDTYLSDAEYMNLLSKATYSVLPYSPDKYDRQTSGVMQEAFFVDTIPVTYNKILDGNGIQGVGFDAWDELNLNDVAEEKISECRLSYQSLRDNVYSKEKISECYRQIFENR